jgi:hypothetical protein
VKILLVAVAAVLVLLGGLRTYSSATPPTASLSFDEAAMAATPEDVTAALGGPLVPADLDRIRELAREEVDRAFSGLRLRFVDTGRAFWRIRVLASFVPPTLSGRPMVNAAGAAYPFGALGGGGFLSFTTLATKAMVYAPPGASRQDMVAAIGRGIGRSAVHELAHLILGARTIHSDDENSYEFETADRPGQYYGELTWGKARRLLEQKLGPDDSSRQGSASSPPVSTGPVPETPSR